MATHQVKIADLVERMPEVDKPKPDAEAKPGQTGKFTGPHPADATSICGDILAGGRASVEELAALVRSPGDAEFTHYKAAYLLHSLVIHVGATERAPQRQLVAEVLAAQLASDRPSTETKKFFLQELQACGGAGVVPALAKLLANDELCEPATRALVSIREGAADQLRAALEKVRGRNRVGMVQGLGRLGDARAVAALKHLASDRDGETRIAAGWALANLGDASAASLLLKAADGATGWERVQAHKACFVLAEKLAATGKKPEAIRIYSHLRDTRQDEKEQYIRDAADKALKGLQPVV